MNNLAASVLSKQDQGHAGSAEGNTDTALGIREQGFRVYTSRIIEHKEKLR